MEMNIRKMDEGQTIISKMNAELTPKMIYNMFDIPITDAEIEYMKDHWKPDELQIKLIRNYYSSYFGNYRDMYCVHRNNFHKLALLLKKRLLLEYGWDATDNSTNEDKLKTVLPYVLTGNLEGKLNSRVIRNSRYNSKLDEDEHYTRVCNDTYSLMLEIAPDEINSIVASMVNSRFTYVTPEDPSLLGKEIVYSEDKIGSEVSFFLDSN